MKKQRTNSPELTEEAIRTRAYQLYEQRGSQPGHELDDWFQAEAELLGPQPAPAAQPPAAPEVVAA